MRLVVEGLPNWLWEQEAYLEPWPDWEGRGVLPALHVYGMEVYDHTGQHPAATVKVGISREPYVLVVCEHHLTRLQQTPPASAVWVVERYTSA